MALDLNPKPKRPPIIYRAVACTDVWGSGDGCDFITGVTLERVGPEPEWDPLYDNIAEGGIEAPIHLPDGGLVVGQFYTIQIEEHVDWETGIADDFDAYIVPTDAPKFVVDTSPRLSRAAQNAADQGETWGADEG